MGTTWRIVRGMAIGVGVCVSLASAGFASDSPASGTSPVGWRTDGTGRYPNSIPPTKWSMSGGKSENLLWATKLPAWSNATPVVWKDRVFVCAEQDTLLCVSLNDGKILWQQANSIGGVEDPKELAKIEENKKHNAELEKQVQANQSKLRGAMQALRKDENDAAAKAAVKEVQDANNAIRAKMLPVPEERKPQTHPTNGYTSPTPVTDGKIVASLFGTGAVGAYDLDGKRLWLREIERPEHGWGQSSSPIMVDGKLIVLVRNLFALDPATGKELWRCNSSQRWGSPVAAKIGETPVIITPGGQIIRASDGKQLFAGLGALEYNSPVVVDGVAYFIQGNAAAWKLPDKIEGDSAKPERVWASNIPNDRYYSSPVIQDGRLYAINQRGAFSILDSMTGKTLDQKNLDLGGTAYPSIVYADAHVLVSSDTGATVVLKPGDKYNEVARNRLEGFRTTPVFAGNRMLIRGQDHLMCFQGDKPVAKAD